MALILWLYFVIDLLFSDPIFDGQENKKKKKRNAHLYQWIYDIRIVLSTAHNSHKWIAAVIETDLSKWIIAHVERNNKMWSKKKEKNKGYFFSFLWFLWFLCFFDTVFCIAIDYYYYYYVRWFIIGNKLFVCFLCRIASFLSFFFCSFNFV